jgi:DNA-binding NarL/FixJ family response regulator
METPEASIPIASFGSGVVGEIAMTRVRVLLADQHQIFTEGLRNLLEPKFEVIDTVCDGQALVKAAHEVWPDIVVMEIALPLLHGIDAIRQLNKGDQQVKVVVLTMHHHAAYAAKALEAGAVGYVLKQSRPAELLTAMDEVMRGRVYVCSHLASDIMQLLTRHVQPQASPRLTLRQWEVLQLLAEGYSAKEVAAQLQISPRTAEFHKYRIMDKLGMRTSMELIHYALKQGIATI